MDEGVTVGLEVDMDEGLTVGLEVGIDEGVKVDLEVEKELEVCVKEGIEVDVIEGMEVGAKEGLEVIMGEGMTVGLEEGMEVGAKEGKEVSMDEGVTVGLKVGMDEGVEVGLEEEEGMEDGNNDGHLLHVTGHNSANASLSSHISFASSCVISIFIIKEQPLVCPYPITLTFSPFWSSSQTCICRFDRTPDTIDGSTMGTDPVSVSNLRFRRNCGVRCLRLITSKFTLTFR